MAVNALVAQAGDVRPRGARRGECGLAVPWRRVSDRLHRRAERLRTRAEELRDLAERRVPVLTELTDRLLSANLLDAGTRLAAQAFLTSVPLLFALGAFAPQGVRDQLLHSLRSVFGLTGAS